MHVRPLAALAATLLVSAPSATRAHDLWLEARGDALVLRYGHRGGDALDLDAAKVRTVLCRRGTGEPADVRAKAAASPKEIRIPARCDAGSAYVDGGYWTLTPEGEKNLPRNQVPDAVRSWQSRQWAKWIDAGAPGAALPLGDDLEIIPVTDLARVREGDKATFRVLWKGKPVEGAVLAVAHKPLCETDAAGECRVRIRSADVESVSVTLRRPLGTPEADTLTAEASLTFRVAP